MASFINSIRIVHKEISSFEIKKFGDRPERIAVNITFQLQDGETKKSFLKDDMVGLIAGINVLFANADEVQKESVEEEQILFRISLKLESLFKFTDDFEVKESIVKEFPDEVLSFVYDDIKLTVEDFINRSSFRGISLPFDFREINKPPV